MSSLRHVPRAGISQWRLLTRQYARLWNPMAWSATEAGLRVVREPDLGIYWFKQKDFLSLVSMLRTKGKASICQEDAEGINSAVGTGCAAQYGTPIAETYCALHQSMMFLARKNEPSQDNTLPDFISCATIRTALYTNTRME